MPAYKFYQREYQEYPKHYNFKLTPNRARLIIKWLCQHYKIPAPVVFFDTKRGGHTMFPMKDDGMWDLDFRYRNGEIHLPTGKYDRISLGLVAHEFTHLLPQGRKHDRKMWNKLKHVRARCERYMK